MLIVEAGTVYDFPPDEAEGVCIKTLLLSVLLSCAANGRGLLLFVLRSADNRSSPCSGFTPSGFSRRSRVRDFSISRACPTLKPFDRVTVSSFFDVVVFKVLSYIGCSGSVCITVNVGAFGVRNRAVTSRFLFVKLPLGAVTVLSVGWTVSSRSRKHQGRKSLPGNHRKNTSRFPPQRLPARTDRNAPLQTRDLPFIPVGSAKAGGLWAVTYPGSDAKLTSGVVFGCTAPPLADPQLVLQSWPRWAQAILRMSWRAAMPG